jgi:hypothetical protein
MRRVVSAYLTELPYFARSGILDGTAVDGGMARNVRRIVRERAQGKTYSFAS